ncbi:putative MATE family efflux protein [Antricoccus suffuscus]|uniref:Putative MATE family efflux protein n=1 Tax=Antricoccus suffuscus TaxID=1629062 RepID=A0A2T1A4P5_9ACTN|nr:putative MATE family efflux protein [Antricoccus suffuscus]
MHLALPAMIVLAAEPLYLVVDTALIGHLGATQLAALAIGGIVLAQVSGQFNFLAYGTTGRAARHYGRNDRAAAVREGVNASWLAVAIGLLAILAVQILAGPIARLIGGDNPVAVADAESWMRLAILGAPGILLALAGNGWMRGVQETRKPTTYVVAAFGISLVLLPIFVYVLGWGLMGSAVANVVAQLIGGGLFIRALLKEAHGPVRRTPHWPVMRAQLRTGRDLLIRTLALQGSFAAAAGVAARMSTETLGAHQIGLQLWMLCALVLDSVAIAAQSLVGEALGAGNKDHARRVALIIGRLGVATGVLLAIILLAIGPFAPHIFTSDPGVLTETAIMWWWLVGMQPLAGYVFAVDGILMGSGDVAILRTITIIASVFVYIPLAICALKFHWGIGGIWLGLTSFIVARLVVGWWRVRGDKWMIADAH